LLLESLEEIIADALMANNGDFWSWFFGHAISCRIYENIFK